MLCVLFWLAVGLLVGWNTTQPQVVKNVVEKVKSLVKK